MSESVDPALEQLYEQKYLKYKKKYLELKRFAQEQEGGLTTKKGNATIFTSPELGQQCVAKLESLKSNKFKASSLSISELDEMLKNNAYIIFENSNLLEVMTPNKVTRTIKNAANMVGTVAKVIGRGAAALASAAASSTRGVGTWGMNIAMFGGASEDITLASNFKYIHKNVDNINEIINTLQTINPGSNFNYVIHMQINRVGNNVYMSSQQMNVPIIRSNDSRVVVQTNNKGTTTSIYK